MGLNNRNDTIRLAENVYLIRSQNGSRFPFCNSFLFTGSENVLLDAGIEASKIREIDGEKRIDTLIISHSHPDHILRWHVLNDRRILLPKETPDSVKDIALLGERFTGTPDKGAYWSRIFGEGLKIQPLREPDGRFYDGFLIDAGESQLMAVHTPGHVEDHYCFFDLATGILFTIDIDFAGFGPWYGNPESDIEKFKQSIKKVMSLKCEQVCSSHKDPIQGDAKAEFTAYLESFARHSQTVLDLCYPPRTLKQIVSFSPFYRNRMSDKILQQIFEEPMVLKNLSLLISEGIVEEKYGQYRRIN